MDNFEFNKALRRAHDYNNKLTWLDETGQLKKKGLKRIVGSHDHVMNEEGKKFKYMLTAEEKKAYKLYRDEEKAKRKAIKDYERTLKYYDMATAGLGKSVKEEEIKRELRQISGTALLTKSPTFKHGRNDLNLRTVGVSKEAKERIAAMKYVYDSYAYGRSSEQAEKRIYKRNNPMEIWYSEMYGSGIRSIRASYRKRKKRKKK